MTVIKHENFDEPDLVIEIIKKSVHGGFISEEKLDEDLKELCEKLDWMEKVQDFLCNCEDRHTTRIGKEICLKTKENIEPKNVKIGYRYKAEKEMDLNFNLEYDYFLYEHSDVVNPLDIPTKSIIFVPDVDQILFLDRIGSKILLPVEKIQLFLNNESRERLLNTIREKRQELINWKELDSEGKEFQEITYRLVSRDERFKTERWGGRGPDQGKDTFCSIELGGRETRVLIQAKFNLSGSLNEDEVQKYLRKANRHDCKGLIISTINTSGDFESEFDKNAFHNKDVHFFRIWPGPEMKEKLSKHPDLLEEYFIN